MPPGRTWSPLGPRIGLPAGLPVPTCPADSLRLATDGPGLPAPPADWGRIRPGPPRRTFAAADPSARPPSALAPRHPHPDPGDEHGDEDGEDGAVPPALSSPVGGTTLSRLLSRLLGSARGRRVEDGDPAGDATGGQAGAGRPRSTRARETTWWAAAGGALAAPAAWGYRYPDCDHAAARYRPAWCTVIERLPDPAEGTVTEVHGRDLGMRRRLARIGLRPELLARRPAGDDLDTDALFRARVAAPLGRARRTTCTPPPARAAASCPCSSCWTSPAPPAIPARPVARCSTGSSRWPPACSTALPPSARASPATPSTRTAGTRCTC